MHDENAWIDRLQRERSVSEKSWPATLALSIFLGFVGADRFYVGRFELGTVKLFTMGGFFFWWIIDILLVATGQMKDGLGRSVRRIV